MIKSVSQIGAKLVRSWSTTAVLLSVQGCALHFEGTQEVATYVQRRAAERASNADVYARAPANVQQPGATQDHSTSHGVLDTLRDFIVVALENNPDIKAAEETARSKAERIVQATALPDPMITTKTLPEPVRTAEGDNFFILGISERFPVPEKLDRAGRIALEETRAALQRLQEARLQVIAEDDVCDVRGRVRAVDAIPVSVLGQQRQAAAVVQMRMREHDRVELGDVDRRHAPVVLVRQFLTLMHAHVEHDAGAIGREHVARAGNLTRRAEEAELDHVDFLAN